MSKFKSVLLAAVGLLVLSNALLLMQRRPAQATSPGVNLAALVAKVSTLTTQQVADEATITADEATIADQQAQITFLKNHPTPGPKGEKGNPGAKGDTGAEGPKGDIGAQGARGLKGDTGPHGPEGAPGHRGDRGPAGASPFTVSGTQNTPDALVTLSGYNLQIVSGSGFTDDGTNGEILNVTTLTGLGNLTIGYNHEGNTQKEGDKRTGSHNLILGGRNSYTGYGGLVAGLNNAISGKFATVGGGIGNDASGDYATVSGGIANKASGEDSSVSGGQANKATNFSTSVSGGYGHTENDIYGWKGGSFSTP